MKQSRDTHCTAARLRMMLRVEIFLFWHTHKHNETQISSYNNVIDEVATHTKFVLQEKQVRFASWKDQIAIFYSLFLDKPS